MRITIINILAFSFFGSFSQAATNDVSRTYLIHFVEQRMTEVMHLNSDNSVTIEVQGFGRCHGVASETIFGNIMVVQFSGVNSHGGCNLLDMSLLYYSKSTFKMFKSMQVGQMRNYAIYFRSNNQFLAEITRIK